MHNIKHKMSHILEVLSILRVHDIFQSPLVGSDQPHARAWELTHPSFCSGETQARQKEPGPGVWCVDGKVLASFLGLALRGIYETETG